MRLKNFIIILALIFAVSFVMAGSSYSARLSEGKKVATPPQKAKVTPQAENTGRASDRDDSSLVSIDFDDVDISLLINFISGLTKKNFIIDNGVKGKVTLISPTKVTIDEAYKIFESVLEVSGFTTVPSGKVIKIIPSRDARSKDIETRFGDAMANPMDRVVTQIIPLTYADPKDLGTLLKNYISKNGLIVPYEPTGVLIVTDVQSNIKRLQKKIIEEIDIPGTGEEIAIIPLKQAGAETMANLLKTIFKAGTSSAVKRPRGVSVPSEAIIESDERTNSIIVLASEVDIIRIKEIINLLDKDTKGEGNIPVIFLQNADAEDLAATLNNLPKETRQAAKPGAAAVLSQGTKVIADKATNSLIITAQKDEYEIIEGIINQLDRPRSMVYIEALIMEVSMKKDLQIGVQWQVGEDGDSEVVYAASNPGVNNFPSVSGTGEVSLPTGLTYGVIGNTISIGGIDFADLGAVFRAYSTDSDVQIHSNPMITILDNEEAELKVTDNVPYITNRSEATSGTGYSNYDYKEVGVKLSITPQINQERFVRLNLEQEVSQVLSFNEEGQPTTFERFAKTVVRVKDGQTLVIGGLIDKKDNRTNYRVPLLGRVPILGWLFRSKTDTTEKKNMYIFLTPRIMENVEEADELSEGKKEHMDAIQQGAIRMHNNSKQPEDMRRVEIAYKYLQLKDYEKALEYYRKALDKNPDNAYAIYNIAYIYQLQGDAEKAVDMYEKLIAMNPPERAIESSDPFQSGRKLTDMAKDNLKSLKADK